MAIKFNGANIPNFNSRKTNNTIKNVTVNGEFKTADNGKVGEKKWNTQSQSDPIDIGNGHYIIIESNDDNDFITVRVYEKGGHEDGTDRLVDKFSTNGDTEDAIRIAHELHW